MIKTAFFIYSTTNEGALNVYYTKNSYPIKAFIVSQEKIDEDPINKILKNLKLEIDSNRITYMGTLTFDGISVAENDIEAIAIDVSSMNMKHFMEVWDLKEQPSYFLSREDNTFILSLVMKLILTKKLVSDLKDEQV